MKSSLYYIGLNLIIIILGFQAITALVAAAFSEDANSCKAWPENRIQMALPGIKVGCFLGRWLTEPLNKK